jgi:hypothetical protein
MSYTARTNVPNLADGETAVDLDPGGQTVVLSFTLARIENTNGTECAVRVRQVDPTTGATRDDVHGMPVCVSHNFNADPGHIDRYTLDVLIREMIKAMLGEPLAVDPSDPPLPDIDGRPVMILDISDDALAHVSIRAAIAAADAATKQGVFNSTILPGN